MNQHQVERGDDGVKGVVDIALPVKDRQVLDFRLDFDDLAWHDGLPLNVKTSKSQKLSAISYQPSAISRRNAGFSVG